MSIPPWMSDISDKDNSFGFKTGFMAAVVPSLFPIIWGAGDPRAAHVIAVGVVGLGMGLNAAASRLVQGPIAKFYSVFFSIPVGYTVGVLTEKAATPTMTGLLMVFASAACARGAYAASLQLEKFKDGYDVPRYTKGALAGLALSSALALGTAFLQEPAPSPSVAPAVPAPAQP